MTPRPVAVLVVIFTVEAGRLQVLLIRRSAEPFKDAWSLPGGLLNPGESLKDAAVRKLDDETGLTDVFLSFIPSRTSMGRARWRWPTSRWWT